MYKTYFDIEQGSDEWLNLRRWKLTGGKISPLLSKKRTLWWEKLIDKLLAEVYINENYEAIKSFAMERWLELEEEAKKVFEKEKNKKIKNIWFIEKQFKSLKLGCSPDGLIWKKEAIEIKCPLWEKTINYFLNFDNIFKDYKWQILNYFLVIDDLEILYFMIYNPDLKSKINYKIYEIKKEDIEEDLKRIKMNIVEFEKDYNEAEINFILELN